jgi:DNA-binding transcriptional LysR family regulator
MPACCSRWVSSRLRRGESLSRALHHGPFFCPIAPGAAMPRPSRGVCSARGPGLVRHGSADHDALDRLVTATETDEATSAWDKLLQQVCGSCRSCEVTSWSGFCAAVISSDGCRTIPNSAAQAHMARVVTAGLVGHSWVLVGSGPIHSSGKAGGAARQKRAWRR